MKHGAAGVSLQEGVGGQQGVATCYFGGEEWGQMEGTRDRERNWSEKMLRAPFQEVNPLVFSLGQTFWF